MPYKDPEAQRAYFAAYNLANREKRREQHREWQHSHPEQLRAYKQRHHANRLATDFAGVRQEQRTAWLSRRYQLTEEAFRAMVAAQDGKCLICGNTPIEGKPLHIDHDHDTGTVRGLLCGHCNRGVGLFRDDPELLESAARYLRRHTEAD